MRGVRQRYISGAKLGLKQTTYLLRALVGPLGAGTTSVPAATETAPYFSLLQQRQQTQCQSARINPFFSQAFGSSTDYNGTTCVPSLSLGCFLLLL